MTIRSIRVIYVKNIAKTSSFSRNSAFPPLSPSNNVFEHRILRFPVNPWIRETRGRKKGRKRRREQTSKRFPYSSLPLYIKRCLARDSLRAETSRGTTKAAIQSAVRIEPHPSCTGEEERKGEEREGRAYTNCLLFFARADLEERFRKESEAEDEDETSIQ